MSVCVSTPIVLDVFHFIHLSRLWFPYLQNTGISLAEAQSDSRTPVAVFITAEFSVSAGLESRDLCPVWDPPVQACESGCLFLQTYSSMSLQYYGIFKLSVLPIFIKFFVLCLLA